jgi:hypothetical protein
LYAPSAPSTGGRRSLLRVKRLSTLMMMKMISEGVMWIINVDDICIFDKLNTLT